MSEEQSMTDIPEPATTTEKPEEQSMVLGPGEGFGLIQCDTSVFREIAGHAAGKVEGIASVGGRTSFGERFHIREKETGVEVVTYDDSNEVSISVNVTVFFGHNIYEVCTELQRRVKDSIESITSYSVRAVDVKVQGLKMSEEPGEALEQ